MTRAETRIDSEGWFDEGGQRRPFAQPIARFIGVIAQLALSGRGRRRAESKGKYGGKTAYRPRLDPFPADGQARISLEVPKQAALVVGWAGPPDLRSGVLDLIEAASICDERVAIVIPATGKAQHRVVDQADARDLLHRIRFAAPEAGLPDRALTIEAFPAMLAAVDALIVAPPRRRAHRRHFRAACALAQAHAIPVISLGATPSGPPHDPATWTIRAGDPGLLARLLTVIAARPELLQAAADAMARQAASTSPAAVPATTAAQRGANAKPGHHAGLGHGAVRRAPSGT